MDGKDLQDINGLLASDRPSAGKRGCRGTPFDAYSTSLKRDYLSLAENPLRPAAVLDAEGRVLRCNPPFGRLLGLEPEDVAGRRFFDLVHEEDGPRLLSFWAELVEKPGCSLVSVFRFVVSPDLAFNTAALWRNMSDHPEIKGVALELLDLSGCAEARKALDEIKRLFCRLGPVPEENLRSIVSSVRKLYEADACFYLRRERNRLEVCASPEFPHSEIQGKGEGRFLALRMLERDAEEPLFVPDLLVEPGLLEDPLALSLNARTFYGQPVLLDGKTVGVICLYHVKPRVYTRDEKENLNLLAHIVSLEEKHRQHEQALRDLVDVVSHELRHPISIILGYAHTLKTHNHRLDDLTRKEILARLENGAKRLEHTTMEILEVSKLEKGMMRLRPETAELTPLLERAVEEMKASGVTNPMYVKAEDGLPAVAMDADKILKVLIILLDNAAKYSPEGSPIDIAAESHPDEVVVSVMDRGPGIPMEDRLLVFEKFYQVEEAMHHSLPGIGLGLYLAREIINAHGGRIWCTEREGGGAVFRFALPL